MLYHNSNKIIQSKNKILFIDTNSSLRSSYNDMNFEASDNTERKFTTELPKDKIIHRDDIYDFNQLFSFLYLFISFS